MGWGGGKTARLGVGVEEGAKRARLVVGVVEGARRARLAPTRPGARAAPRPAQAWAEKASSVAAETERWSRGAPLRGGGSTEKPEKDLPGRR